ncbi:MAG TPA: DUF58 domain-containing protein [Saprospiraceae bacterium]|nr:DUF58 domain-containing protein [Saprospiraceae bacterium]
MDTAELMKKVRQIEIKMKGLNTQLFSGEYHSAFKGRGMSFSEVREYSYGDDVRNIEWNVTARAGHPYVKIFEEERELTLILLIDVSKSLQFGTVEKTKKETMLEIAAVLAFSALTNNDKVGAIFFSNEVEGYLPPKKGRANVLKLIRQLLTIEPKSKTTDVSKALNYLNNIQKKRCIVFALSDFLSPDYEKALTLTAKRHDLIGVNVFDRYETDLPKELGMLPVIDAENGGFFYLDAGEKNFRASYFADHQDQVNKFTGLFRKYGAHALTISTEDDYIKSLIDMFRRR